MKPSGRPVRPSLKLALKLALAAALVAWLLQTGRLDLAVYRALLAGPHLLDLVQAFVWQGAAFMIFIARWRGLARAAGLDIAWRPVFHVGLQGLSTQLVVPGGLGTDGLRLLQVQGLRGGSLALGVSLVVADRLVGLVGLALTGMVASAVHLLSTGAADLLPGLLACAALLGAIAAALVGVHLLLRVPALRRLRAPLERLSGAVDAFRSQPAALATAVGVSMMGHLATGVAAWHSLQALEAGPLSFSGVLAIVCLLNVVRMVPVTPMGLGVTDTLGERWFAWIGSTLGAEQQMLQRAVSVCLYLLAGLAFFGRSRPGPSG